MTLGHLKTGRLEEMLREYDLGLQTTGHGYRLAGAMAELLADALEDVAGMSVRVGEARPWSDDLELPCQASLTLDSVPALRVTLQAELVFAQALARGTLGTSAAELDQTSIWKGMKELLFLLADRAREAQDRQEFLVMLEDRGIARLSDEERESFRPVIPLEDAALGSVALPVDGGPGAALVVFGEG